MKSMTLKTAAGLTILIAGAMTSGCGKAPTFSAVSETTSYASGADMAQLASAAQLNQGVEELLDENAGDSTQGETTRTSCSSTPPALELPASDAEMLGLLETGLEELIERIAKTEQIVERLPEVEGLPKPQDLLKELQEKRRRLTTDAQAQAQYENGKALAKKNRALMEQQIECLRHNGPIRPDATNLLPRLDGGH